MVSQRQCSFRWCPGKACPVGLYQEFCFRYSCAGLSAEARCKSWTWAATRPLAGNPNGMVCKLVAREALAGAERAEKRRCQRRATWAVRYGDGVQDLPALRTSAGSAVCLLCPASWVCSLLQRGAEFIWLLVTLPSSCRWTVLLRVKSVAAVRDTGEHIFRRYREIPTDCL